MNCGVELCSAYYLYDSDTKKPQQAMRLAEVVEG